MFSFLVVFQFQPLENFRQFICFQTFPFRSFQIRRGQDRIFGPDVFEDNDGEAWRAADAFGSKTNDR